MNTIRRWAVRTGQLVVIALIVWGILRAVGLDLDELRATDLASWRPAPAPLLLSTAALLLVYFAQAFLWRRVLADLTGARPTAAATIRIYFLAILGRYIPGKVWPIAGFAVLAKRAALPALGAAASAIISQLLFLVTGALFLTLLLPAWAGPVPAVLATLVLALGCAAFFWTYATGAGSRLRTRLADRFGTRVEAALDMIGRIRLRDSMIWLIAYSATWIALGAAFALFVSAFVSPANGADVRHLAGTVAAAYLGGYIAVFAPGGIGVREALMSALLVQVMPLSAAIVVSVASRVWFTAAELVPLAAIPFLPNGTVTAKETCAEQTKRSEPRSRTKRSDPTELCSDNSSEAV